ncbi:acyl-CoA dehydrogenase family protein [Myxococcota bacterium]|nr:acyl-CoA dehydrogenase family protein [Myxococcota bacterium]MCZ7617410.1 acyl-CoA dehydrogenase family protein [Myxococcota bacterium]
MRVELTPEQCELQQFLRGYFVALMTPALQAELQGSEGGGPLYRVALQKMGADGWLGIGWPKEYGGQGRTPIEQMIFADEVQRAGFPLPFLTLNTVGPTLAKFGSDELRQEFLPRILRGECHFSIGYSEPEAGTDLGALKTRAVRDGEDWILDGQKVFTSLADFADYVWLAARTDPAAPKHRGISIFIVPTDTPGFKMTPTWTVGDVRTNTTYYEQVRVPNKYLVGGENNGWGLIVSQLNHERVSLTPHGPSQRLLEQVRQWALETRLADGRRVIDQSWVRDALAWVHVKLEALRLMQWKLAWSMTQGALHPADASAVKVYATEMYVQAYRKLMEVLGPAGAIQDGSPGAVARGRLERMYRATLILTFGGGTNEVQRDIIAMAGLGLPHYKT